MRNLDLTHDPVCVWILKTLQHKAEPCSIFELAVRFATTYEHAHTHGFSRKVRELEEAGYIRSYDGDYYILWAHSQYYRYA